MILIEEQFQKTGLLLDKTTQSLTALPYTYDSVKVKSNSFVSYNTFNNIIKKIYDNYMFMYRCCNIGSFDMFTTYQYTLSTLKNSPFFNSIENGYESTVMSNSLLSSSENGVVLPYSEEERGSYVFFTNKTSVICVFTSKFNPRLVFNTDNIGPLSSNITYKNIVDIKTDYYEYLYIADSEYNNIYQFSIKNFLSKENIYIEKLFVKNYIGGSGGINDNEKFKKIKNIAVNDNFVIAQDSENNCFKIFDKNLSWLGTFVFDKVFKKYIDFDDIMLYKNNKLYCCKNNNIVIFDYVGGRLVLSEEIKVEQYLDDGEHIKKIILSSSNNNIVYLLTNKSVKKAWITNLKFLLGEFKYSNNKVNIKWLSAAPKSSSEDIIILYSLIDNKEQFSVNFDSITIDSILNRKNFLIYSLEETLIKKEEYVTSFVVLKNLQKCYYNILLLLQNIKYKFLESSDLIYPIIKEKIYNTAFLGFSNQFEFESNFDIGINEVFQAEVLNRAIKEIINLQEILLFYIINNKNETVYLSPEPEKGKISVRQYIYFVDDSLVLSPNPAKLDIFEELRPGNGILTSLGGAPYSPLDGIFITEGVNI